MANLTALSEGLCPSRARPKITDEEETTLCPPDRGYGAQTVSEVQTPNLTPLGNRCEDPHVIQAGVGMPAGFAMLKVSMIMSQKLQGRGVSFLPESKPSTSKEDRPLAKVGTAPWLTRSFRRQRPIPPAPESQEKQEVTHRIILDQLKEEQEAASRSSPAPTKHEQGMQETTGRTIKHRATNDQLKEISDRNEINTWLHDSNNSEGGETIQRSMQKANSNVGGFLYRHELLRLFPCLDGNTWNAETTEELLAKSGLQFCNDGKIEVATFFHWLVQAASSERIRLVG